MSDESLIQLLNEESLEDARKGLLAFTLRTKPDYQVNWHHKALCRVLNRFTRGEIKRLMVFTPPRNGKSELVSRRLPAFIHGRNPNAEIMLATYNGDIATDMTIDVQRIIDSPSYAEIFPKTKITAEGSKSSWARNSSEYEIMPFEGIAMKGNYRAQGIGGSFTGRGADYIIIDDPVKNREDADSATERENVYNFYTSTLYTRLEKEGQILLTMTRWHEDDLAGRLLRKMREDRESDQWEVFSFPAIKETDDNPEDTRKIGDALWSDKYPLATLNTIRATAGTRDWAALFQQRPTADGGDIVKRSWIKRYDALPLELEEKIIVADLSFKDGPQTDFTCIECWGRKATDIYLIDQIRDRMDFPRQMGAIRSMSARHPEAYSKYIEEAANGAAIISLLKNEIMGLVPVKPHTSKQARITAVSPLYEAGNVHYPSERLCPWVEINLSELLTFPNAGNDDTVDCASMALQRLGQFQNSIMRLEALSKL